MPEKTAQLDSIAVPTAAAPVLSVPDSAELAAPSDALQRENLQATQQYGRPGDSSACRVHVIGALTLTQPDGGATSDPLQCAELLRAAGPDYSALSSLQPRGHFGAIIADGGHGRAALITDRIGTVPLYYATDPLRAHCSSDLAALRKAYEELNGRSNLNEQALYHYMYFHMIPAPHSVFGQARRVKAASICIIEAGHAATEQRYWNPTFIESTSTSPDSLSAELRQALRSAVKRKINPNARTGAFLSGGLDSSTVAGMLAEESDNGALAFAIGFNADGYDEMPWARATAEHFGITLIERYVTPEDVIDALPFIARSFAEPFGNSSALPAYFCAREAKRLGIDVLLAGDGGDELFAGNERYASHRAFELYDKLPGIVRGPLQAFADLVPKSMPGVAKLSSFLAQARLSEPERLQHYNFLHQIAPADMFHSDFLELVSTGLPLQEWCDQYNAPEAGSSPLNRKLYMDWQYTLADNDLRKVSQACAACGVEAAYPMLDDEVLDLSTRIPSAWKLRPQNLRAFYKDTFSGWLPDGTISKEKHGFGLPFGVWMREHPALAELAYDTISRMGRLKIFRANFLDDAISLHRNGHSAYYGELIWLLTVLGLWLDNHERCVAFTDNIGNKPCPP